MAELIGRYRIVRRLGRGGMGSVWLAEDDGGRRVAVKVINAELARKPEFRERFRQEVQASRKVRRFCTAPVIDAGLDGDPLWIATEFIDGPTVEEAVFQNGPLRAADLDALAVGIATALGAFHDAELVHRDLKPSNVMLSPVGPRVIDFGLAKALDSAGQLTRPGFVIGTPGYIAPELLTGGRPTPAADVFSWGAVIAYAGTGRHAFDGAAAADINAQVVRAEPDLSGLDPQLRPLVARALAKDPGLRPTASRLLSELTGSPAPVRGGAVGRPPAPAAAHPARRLAPYALGGTGLLVLAGVITLTLTYLPGTADGKSGVPPIPSPVTSSPVSTPSMSSHMPFAFTDGPIANDSSGLCVDPAGAGRPGVPVRIRHCRNDSGQRWSYSADEKRLEIASGELCLDAEGRPATGVDVVLGPCGNYADQKWHYRAATHQFTNLGNDLCLDTAGRPADNARLVLDPCGNNDAGQQWHA